MEINKEVLRWVLLIGAIPIWVPFLRTLWRDFNHSLRDEGGLIGVPPRGHAAEVLREEKKRDAGSLVSEPILKPGDRRVPRMKSPSARPKSSPRGGSSSRSAEPRRYGFKQPGSRRP
ncbi:MAG: hypothetical protein JNL28_07980 [Planctomycetes bacterium]|nr:hypothetical protein [Planctomycetota bacterium]